MEFFTAPGNVPFSVALAVVLLLGAFEVLSLVLGGASSLLSVDGPDMGFEMGDGDADFEASGGPLSNLFTWLHAGQIPVMVLLFLFLLGFGISGLILQNLLKARFDVMLPAGVAVIPAAMIALLWTRLSGGLLKPIMPRDETESVSLDSFVGCAAHINIGTARPGQPAEARVVDKFGRSHYVMVEPEHDEEFQTGSPVLLIKRNGHVYRVIDNTGGEI